MIRCERDKRLLSSDLMQGCRDKYLSYTFCATEIISNKADETEHPVYACMHAYARKESPRSRQGIIARTHECVGSQYIVHYSRLQKQKR